MAKATITKDCAVCGTKVTKSRICYNRKEANSWEQWMEDQDVLCYECYRKAQAERRAKENEEVIEQAKENAFGIDIDALELGGSEKQNAWAKILLAEYVNVKDNKLFTWDLVCSGLQHKGKTFAWEDFGVATEKDACNIIAEIIKSLQAREILDNRGSIRVLVAGKILDKYNQIRKEETK